MMNNNIVTANTANQAVVLHPRHRTFSVYDIARFLHEKHEVMGPVVTKLITVDSRRDEVPMKTSIELKKKLAEEGRDVGDTKIPRIKAKDMKHIDDDQQDNWQTTGWPDLLYHNYITYATRYHGE